ncbi:MAG: hypothetical protein EBX52_02035 [Proteobacteria bacterium]|nr:hypothetical protein [Pseudomonadota bacterium]
MLIGRVHLFRLLNQEWERVRDRPWFRNQRETLFELERSRFSRLFRLSGLIAGGAFRQSKPFRIRYIQFDKLREIVEIPLEDQLVHGLLKAWIEPGLDALLSSSVHSFRKGRSVETALRHILAEVARYRAKVKKRDRALHVLRFDIKKCGESIPVHPHSRLWPKVASVLPLSGPVPRENALNLLRSAIRPEVERADASGVHCWRFGTPTGSPLQPLILNLYLSILDDFFLKQGGIYCRYGDDFFFAHADEEVFVKVNAELPGLLKELELEVRPEKMKSFRWTGSGHRGSTMVDFLGMELHFNGQTRLNAQKQKIFSRQLKRAIQRCFHQLAAERLEVRASIAKILIDQSFGVRPGWLHPYMARLLRLVDDRGQLKALDYEVFRAFATAMTGNPRVSAFREVSPRQIREHFGIPSLVKMRNRR